MGRGSFFIVAWLYHSIIAYHSMSYSSTSNVGHVLRGRDWDTEGRGGEHDENIKG